MKQINWDRKYKKQLIDEYKINCMCIQSELPSAASLLSRVMRFCFGAQVRDARVLIM